MQAVKERYVKLLGVGVPEDVAVTPSTSYALSLVAASLHLEPEQQIVVLEAQSASNVMQWQVLGPGVRVLVVYVRVRARVPASAWCQDGCRGGALPQGRLLSYTSVWGETCRGKTTYPRFHELITSGLSHSLLTGNSRARMRGAVPQKRPQYIKFSL